MSGEEQAGGRGPPLFETKIHPLGIFFRRWSGRAQAGRGRGQGGGGGPPWKARAKSCLAAGGSPWAVGPGAPPGAAAAGAGRGGSVGPARAFGVWPRGTAFERPEVSAALAVAGGKIAVGRPDL